MIEGAPRHLLADFRRFAGRRLLLLSLLMLGGALAEGLGIAILVPLLALAGGAELPPLFSTLLGMARSLGPAGRFGAALTAFLVLMLLRSLLLYSRDLTMARLEADYTADLRLRAAGSLAQGGWTRASRVGLAGMQSLLLTEIPRCIFAVHEMQMAVVTTVLLLVQFGLAILLSPTLAAIAFLVIMLGLAASWGLLKSGRRRGVAISAHGEQSSSAGFRLHSGLKAALAQGTAAQFLRDYGRSLASLSREIVGYAGDLARTRAIASMGAAVAAVVLMLVGHQWLQLPFALLATSLILFARMSGPAQSLQRSIHGFTAFAPAFESVERIVGPLRSAPLEQESAADPLEWRELRLEQASYVHQDSGFRLDGADLTIRAGEWVGLCGPSGGGKTTLADLAVALLHPQQGELKLDGRPLDESVLPRWRQGLAYIAQNEMTFDASVRQNLLAGATRQHDDQSLWTALALVGLDSRIREFEQGLDTELGDRGSALSGGERQRLAVARALLRRPTLIVLDEATNALDQESETMLLGRLRALEPRPAVLLIAHRPGPLELCDRTIRVDSGKVHES